MFGENPIRKLRTIKLAGAEGAKQNIANGNGKSHTNRNLIKYYLKTGAA